VVAGARACDTAVSSVRDHWSRLYISLSNKRFSLIRHREGRLRLRIGGMHGVAVRSRERPLHDTRAWRSQVTPEDSTELQPTILVYPTPTIRLAGADFLQRL